MLNPNQCSKEQLQLQARIARRRIEEIQAVLESGIQAPLNQGLDPDTAEVVRRSFDISLSDADMASCISILEMTLSTEVLMPLVMLMKNSSRTFAIREQAAEAIQKIGTNHVREELAKLEASDSEELRSLAAIALGR